MLKLNATEVSIIVEKFLKDLYPEFKITNVRVLKPSLDKMSYNEARKVWSLNSANSTSIIMAYHNGFRDTPVTLEQVKYFIKKEYTEAKSVSVEFEYPTLKEAQEKVFLMQIHFDDEADLTKENIEDLIDIALSTNDEEWFKELTIKYKKVLKGV